MNRRGSTRPGHLRLVAASPGRDERFAIDQRAWSRSAPAGPPIRVLIAAGQALARASYRALLEQRGRIEVVGEAASGEDAVAVAITTRPDVVLLELELPDLHDFDNTAAIVSHPAFAGVAVMLIAVAGDDERVFGGLRAGAVGVLLNDAGPNELLRALQALAAGQALLPSEVVRRLIAELPPLSLRHRPVSDQLGELTDREREVVTLVGMGLSNAEIAARLVISPATAKTHVSRAMVKLRAHDRAKLVVLAYEGGLVREIGAIEPPAAAAQPPATS